MGTSLTTPNTKETWTDDKPIYPQVVTVVAGGADLTGTYAHSIAAFSKIWVRQATIGDGTEAYPLPHFNGDGLTALRINGANIEVSQVGNHDWTGFTLDVFLEYTV
jgi:hypothetical protein